MATPIFDQEAGGTILTNVNNTIQGDGVIYNNGTMFNNHAAASSMPTPLVGSLITTLALEYGVFNNRA